MSEATRHIIILRIIHNPLFKTSNGSINHLCALTAGRTFPQTCKKNFYSKKLAHSHVPRPPCAKKARPAQVARGGLSQCSAANADLVGHFNRPFVKRTRVILELVPNIELPGSLSLKSGEVFEHIGTFFESARSIAGLLQNDDIIAVGVSEHDVEVALERMGDIEGHAEFGDRATVGNLDAADDSIDIIVGNLNGVGIGVDLGIAVFQAGRAFGAGVVFAIGEAVIVVIDAVATNLNAGLKHRHARHARRTIFLDIFRRNIAVSLSVGILAAEASGAPAIFEDKEALLGERVALFVEYYIAVLIKALDLEGIVPAHQQDRVTRAALEAFGLIVGIRI